MKEFAAKRGTASQSRKAGLEKLEIVLSVSAFWRGGQKFLPPNPLPFCPPERLDFKIRNSDFRQKMFELCSKNTANLRFQRFLGLLPCPRYTRARHLR